MSRTMLCTQCKTRAWWPSLFCRRDNCICSTQVYDWEHRGPLHFVALCATIVLRWIKSLVIWQKKKKKEKNVDKQLCGPPCEILDSAKSTGFRGFAESRKCRGPSHCAWAFSTREELWLGEKIQSVKIADFDRLERKGEEFELEHQHWPDVEKTLSEIIVRTRWRCPPKWIIDAWSWNIAVSEPLMLSTARDFAFLLVFPILVWEAGDSIDLNFIMK